MVFITIPALHITCKSGIDNYRITIILCIRLFYCTDILSNFIYAFINENTFLN